MAARRGGNSLNLFKYRKNFKSLPKTLQLPQDTLKAFDDFENKLQKFMK